MRWPPAWAITFFENYELNGKDLEFNAAYRMKLDGESYEQHDADELE